MGLMRTREQTRSKQHTTSFIRKVRPAEAEPLEEEALVSKQITRVANYIGVSSYIRVKNY